MNKLLVILSGAGRNEVESGGVEESLRLPEILRLRSTPLRFVELRSG